MTAPHGAFAIRRTLAAGTATGLALAALFPAFHDDRWFWRVLGTVVVVTAAGIVARATRLPRPLQPVLALLALGAYVVVVFASGTLHGAIPTGHTLDVLNALMHAGNDDISRYGAPIAPTDGIVLLTALGVGAVALVVDLIAVLLDRVAVAGVPLLVLFAVPSAVLPGGLGGTAFAISAAGWLVLLLEEGSERVGCWGTPMRAALPGARPGGDDSSLGRVGRRIGAAALGVAVLVPAFVPGLNHRLVGGHGGGPGGGSGNGPSSAVTYNPITTLKSDLTLPTPRQLLVYSTDDPQPDYLRMTTLDVYADSGWSSSRLVADRHRARVQSGIAVPVGESAGTGHTTYTTRLAVDGTHLDVHWLPVPFGPRKVSVHGTWLWDPRSQTVFSASQTTKSLPPYTVTGSRVTPTRDDLVAASGRPIDPDIQAQYGEALTVTPDVVALTQRITRGTASAYDAALAIQQYFRSPGNGFVYDLNASQGVPGQDDLEAFLQGKHGFCEQYATAMAVLLRVAGIPSRVAVGFTPGQPVPGRPGEFRVTTSDAHAWPEAWFSGIGWVRFEPTPSTNGTTVPSYTAPRAVTPKPAASTGPTASASPVPGGPRFRDPDVLLKGGGSHPTASGPTGGNAAPWLLLALLPLLLTLPWLGTTARRRGRARRMAPLVAWAQLQDDATDVGYPWRAADSPRATAARLRPLVDAAAHDALARLAAAAEVARYAPPGRRTGADLVADGTAVRRALQASAPRLVRWRAVVWPPSTLRLAAHVTSERVADVLDLVDRAITGAFRPVRRLLRV